MAQTSMFKVSQLAKDFGMKNKDLMTKLESSGISVKSYMAVLEPEDFNLFFDELTRENQIRDLDGYLSGTTYIRRAKTAEEVAAEKAAAEKAAAEKAAAEKAAAEKAAAEKAAAEKAAAEKAAAEKAAAEKAAAEKAAAETKKPDQPQGGLRPNTNGQQGGLRPNTNGQQGGLRPNTNGQPQGGLRPNTNGQPQGGLRPNTNGQPQGGLRPNTSGQPQGGLRPNTNGQPQGGLRPNTNGQPQGGLRPNTNGQPQGGLRPNTNGQPQGGLRPNTNGQPQGTPRQNTPKQPSVERKRTGNIRVIDTRTTNVDLSKYDERLDTFAPDATSDLSAGKQKLKKQNNRDNRSAKNRDKERLAMEKLRRENMEKLRRLPVKVTIPDEITVGDLASRLKKTAGDVIKKMMMMGMPATVNQVLDYDTAYLIADEFGAKITREVVVSIEERLFSEDEEHSSDLVTRAPVVCVMGHVDHGKTSLLDAIRHTNVTQGEAGGITQHIGAYRVNIGGRDITFLDTPGHEAFTAMRARGAQATDIAILVVAADDGIMPQTVEAIHHAKNAGVDVIVAINKIDKPHANPDAVKQQLTNYELVPEEWGGDTICVPVSAVTGEGIDALLESVLLVADVKELKANPQRRAKGIVIEAKLDRGRGPVATVIVQNGTLRAGDIVIAGTSVGHVRAMLNDRGETVEEAGPSVPVEIVGLAEVPQAGDEFNAVEDERMARTLADQRREKAKNEEFNATAKVNLEDLFSQIKEGVKELNIIVKADVGGSAEAVRASLEKLSNDEVKVKVIHSAVGGIRESDVMLAASANAIIVGFNVRPDKNASDMAERDHVDIRTYRIIYECIGEIEAAMKGMLAPEYREVLLGRVEVRQTIRVPNVGIIAGSYVTDGKVTRQSQIRIVRDGVVIFEDKIGSLRRFKDDVKEVAQGYECGIGLEKYDDIHVGDVLEAFVMEEVAR